MSHDTVSRYLSEAADCPRRGARVFGWCVPICIKPAYPKEPALSAVFFMLNNSDDLNRQMSRLGNKDLAFLAMIIRRAL
jgi:hypothetical protein